MPKNRPQAYSRLMRLKSRFKRDHQYFSDYKQFMDHMLENCAERINDKNQEKSGKVNYVPNHGVYHKKPGKIRVVFDCSALYEGTSLNQKLLQGPDLTNNLLGVLCRFRNEPIAFSCDVEGMFNQFLVNKKDRDLLRFLWFEEGNIEARPMEYRMKVHIFGAASSPGCANFAFKQAAGDGEAEFGSETAEFVRRDFYVDDGLKSMKNPEEAIALIENSQKLCTKAGLRLHKFVSNSKEVIEAIPSEDRAKGLQDLDLNHDSLPAERTLGIIWCIELDCFQFKIDVQVSPLTRRGVLSTISSVFDPLGFAAPLILVGKQILQDLCRENCDWDDPIPDRLKSKWEQWCQELHILEHLKVRRCYKPDDFGETVSAELHHFSDASQSGYGQCTYLRLMDNTKRVHCSLVMGKARVAPLKSVTIPRLELSAAVVSARSSKWLENELAFPNVVKHFWTDSKVVLGYISNPSRRFHVYVANRIQEIHNRTNSVQWHHVESEENPADAASRGISALQLVQESRWIDGPKFLWDPNFTPVATQPDAQVDPMDPEVRKVSSLVT